MFKRADKKPAARPAADNPGGQGLPTGLEEQISLMEGLFCNVDVFITRRFQNQHDPRLRYCIFYCDGLVNAGAINDFILRPLIFSQEPARGDGLLEDIVNQRVTVGEAEITGDLEKIIQALNYGDTVLCADGASRVVIFNSKGFVLRSTGEPESEKVLSGPREGFNEGIMMNLSMIRRRLCTNNLKMVMRSLGRQSKTRVCVCYLEGVVNTDVLETALEQIDKIDIDGVLDSNYVAEYISPVSALGFGTCGVTERPDIIAAKLLEGRIAIVVDGSPAVLTLPYLFIENFQSNEDYYVNYVYSSFSRLLRMVGFILTVTVPALYVAIVTHHHEIIPSPLLISIASERQNVPFPAALEAFFMLLTFDILRETGIRMPTGIGQALSIVGALVIGQSAVEAGLVSAPMIIVVAFTGITNLLVPKMSAPALVARYGLLVLTTAFGLMGMVGGGAVLVTHIINLQSAGIEHVLPFDRLSAQSTKDIFIRSSWQKMLQRLSPLSHNLVRARPAGKRRGQ